MIEDIDYLISSVEYDSDNKMIDKVRTHEKQDEYGVGYPYAEHRKQLLNNLKEGKSYYTLVQQEGSEFDYNVGEKVVIVEIQGNEYIRIDKERNEKNYLGDVKTMSPINTENEHYPDR